MVKDSELVRQIVTHLVLICAFNFYYVLELLLFQDPAKNCRTLIKLQVVLDRFPCGEVVVYYFPVDFDTEE